MAKLTAIESAKSLIHDILAFQVQREREREEKKKKKKLAGCLQVVFFESYFRFLIQQVE